jgi:hypothetical protein
VSRYETIALGLVDPRQDTLGRLLESFPPADSPLKIDNFFKTIYACYDERYVYGAPDLKSITLRDAWSVASPVFDSTLTQSRQIPELDYSPRLSEA